MWVYHKASHDNATRVLVTPQEDNPNNATFTKDIF